MERGEVGDIEEKRDGGGGAGVGEGGHLRPLRAGGGSVEAMRAAVEAAPPDGVGSANGVDVDADGFGVGAGGVGEEELGGGSGGHCEERVQPAALGEPTESRE